VTALAECANWLLDEGSNFLLANLYAHKGYDTISQHRRATRVHDFHEKLDALMDMAFRILQTQPSASAEQDLAKLRRPYGSLIEADVLHQRLLVGLRRHLTNFDIVSAHLGPTIPGSVGLMEIRRSLKRGIQELEMLVAEGQPGITAGQQALAVAMADVAQQGETRAKDTELHLKPPIRTTLHIIE
jgi:hypothetical protein